MYQYCIWPCLTLESKACKLEINFIVWAFFSSSSFSIEWYISVGHIVFTTIPLTAAGHRPSPERCHRPFEVVKLSAAFPRIYASPFQQFKRRQAMARAHNRSSSRVSQMAARVEERL